MKLAPANIRKNMRDWFGMRFDCRFNYVTQECTPGKETELFKFFHDHTDIKLKYVEGCFYPYLIQTH